MRILRSVLTQACALTIIGIVIATVIAAIGIPLIKAMLYGITTRGTGELAVAAIAMLVVTIAAASAAGLARRLEAGIVHVNLHTAYREPALPVAGWRESGRGLPECGRFSRDFYTRPRAFYLRRP